MSTPPTTTDRRVPTDTFAVRLKLARHHAGDLTIRDAADRCGLNYGSWSNWERGGKPRDLLETVDAIAEGLGVDRDWLLRGGPLAAEVRRRRSTTTPSLRTPIGRVHQAARTDTGRGATRRTGRKVPVRHPMAA